MLREKSDDAMRQDAPEPQAALPGEQRRMNPEPVSIRKSYVGARKLAGRVALISGADSGIGRAVAVHFAREGCDVAFMYLNEHADARETVRLVEGEGRNVLAIPGDARSVAHCRKAVARTVRQFGRLDILVNNLARQVQQKKPERITPAQLKRTFETNVYPFFHLSEAALEHIPRGGCIINTGSVTSFRGHESLIDYASTKGAIETFTYSMAQNLAPRGIRVNGVAPGPIWTPLIPATFPPDKVKTFGSDVPLGRAGQPEEVAPAYVFLASDDSSYFTGQVLHPNGGEVVNA